MGQVALETTLHKLKLVLLLPFYFAGQIIYEIGGLYRISLPSNKGNLDWFI